MDTRALLQMMRRVLFSTVLLPSAARAFVPMAPSALSRAALATRGGGARALSASPIAIVVNVEIKPERVDDFLAAMAEDVRGSREEAGCYRFDLLRDQSADNKFVFYEVTRHASLARARRFSARAAAAAAAPRLADAAAEA